MVKKSRKSRFRNPARAAARENVASIAAVRVERALAGVTPGFAHWLAARDVDAESIEFDVAVLEDFFEAYAAIAQPLDVKGPAVEPVLAVLRDAGDSNPMAEYIFLSSLERYVSYLAEGDLWTGTPDGLAALQEFVANPQRPSLGPVYDPEVFDSDLFDDEDLDGFDLEVEVPPRPDIDVRPLAPARALRDLQALEVVHRAARLLAWIGNGKKDTAAGLLRRRDLAAAGACVGLNVAGPGEAVAPGPGGPVQLRSMHDSPVLMRYWGALEESGLIEFSDLQVNVAAKAAPFLDGSGDLAATAREFATAMYRNILLPFDFDGGDNLPAWLRAFQLASAASAAPLPAAAVLDSEIPGSPAGGLINQFRAELATWADDGLVTVADVVTVPPVLRQPLARALAQVDAFMEALRVPEREEPEEPEATFRLRVELDGMEPPVWRSLDVGSWTPLDRLHDCLQELFGWKDEERHWFRTGDPHTGNAYTSLNPYHRHDPDYDPNDEPDDLDLEAALEGALEEMEFSLNQIVGEQGDTFTYAYGTEWVHTVTLADVLPPRPEDELPVCTAGSGHSPREGMGGPSEWARVVAVSRDPQDLIYSMIRRRLGLQAGEDIDPAAFDIKQANDKLGVFRHL